MTEFEETYRQLIALEPARRRRWLLQRRPADVSPTHWWLALIDSAVTDVWRAARGAPRATGPRADIELAAALIDWALPEGFPFDYATEYLVQLVRTAHDAGREPGTLPAAARPDRITRQALDRFGFTPAEAVARAARLRDRPLTDDDFVAPGEDIAERLRLLTATDDYQDHHRLLAIQRTLINLRSIAGLLIDPGLAARLAAWLRVLPDLHPVSADPVENLPRPRGGDQPPAP